jgi:hypothetical protein
MSTSDETSVASTIIRLMRGVVYRESEEDAWLTLERRGGAVRDHFATIGVQVVVDDVEGYAYLRAAEVAEGEPELPRLVRRRALTYHVSLLLVLLRKQLLQHENDGVEGQLVVSRDQLVEAMRLFLPESSNDAKTVDLVDTTIRRTVELGFLRPLRSQPHLWEVRRILKAYVDAETLGDFAAKLEEYAEHVQGVEDE